MLDRIALILVIIGGINWGSIGLFKFDIVGWSRCSYQQNNIHSCCVGGSMVYIIAIQAK